jgi:hypothetical protein
MADWGKSMSIDRAFQLSERTNVKHQILLTTVACLVLWSGPQVLQAGWFSNADDLADGCGTGSGGGDPTHGAAPGVKGSRKSDSMSLTKMVDGMGTTRYAYDAAGKLLAENGS